MQRSKKSASARARRTVLAALPFCAALLGGCQLLQQQQPGTLVVHNARVVGDAASRTLELGLDCQLSGPMRDALEHGIPITLRVDLSAGSWPATMRAPLRVELRYFPLSRRYQLRDPEGEEVRSFATPAYLIAALGSLRLELPPKFASLPRPASWRVAVALDPSTLPGALRLPASFEPAWRLRATDYAWTDAAR